MSYSRSSGTFVEEYSIHPETLKLTYPNFNLLTLELSSSFGKVKCSAITCMGYILHCVSAYCWKWPYRRTEHFTMVPLYICIHGVA